MFFRSTRVADVKAVLGAEAESTGSAVPPRRWLFSMAVLLVPPLATLAAWAALGWREAESPVELRESGVPVASMSASEASAVVGERLGFEPWLPSRLPRSDMSLRWVDSTLPVESRLGIGFAILGYVGPTLTVTIQQSDGPNSPPFGHPPELEGAIDNGKVWWFPSEGERIYLVRTQDRFMFIDIKGENLPDNAAVVEMIKSIVAGR